MAEDFSKEITTESTPNTTPTEELTPDSEIEF